MIISDTAVKNRVSVVILSIIIVAFGIYCYRVLPRESEPDITIPYVFVLTNYKGVSAADIETSITIPIEKKLKGLDRVKKIRSISSEGASQINIEFLPATDIDKVLQKVKDKVDEAKGDLPNDLENDPVIYEVNFSEMPIVVYSISGTCGIKILKDIADDLQDEIEGIPGVLEVAVTGGLEREIKIEVDSDKLAYYRIPITAFQSVVVSENQNTSGGSISLGDGRFQLRVPGEFKTPEEIYGLVVSSYEGRPVYLKDVARVIDGFKDETSRSRLDGRDAVSITIKKRVGENILSIAEKVDKIIETHQPGWPKGTTITKLMDKAKEIRSMIADLENNIISGLLLVVAVLLFMGLRNSIMVGMAIPFSMFLSFMIFYAVGMTLNMVVLFSLTLALGMLVDNSIVIIENVYRYMEQGVPKIEASMKATSEVAYPVIASTLTTVAAFLPMMFWPGIMGEFMKYLPLTLIITLSASLFVAMVINPAFAAYFMKTKRESYGLQTIAMSADEIEKAGEKPIEIKGAILKSYKFCLEIALNHRIVVLLISFCVLIILIQVWMLKIGLERPIEFFPKVDPKNIYINIVPPEGADLEYVDRIVKKVEMAVTGYKNPDSKSELPFPADQYHTTYKRNEHRKSNSEIFYGPSDLENAEYIYSKTVETASSSTFEENSPNHVAVQFIDFEFRNKPSYASMEIIRDRVKDIPGARITVAEQNQGPPTGSPINIEISGDDFATLGALAKQVREIVAKVPFVEDVRDDYVEAIPSIRVRIDRQKAALFGLSTNLIGFALKTAYNGLDVSTYREGDEDYDITVTLGKEDRKVTDVLRKLMIPAPSGLLVPLTTIGSIDYAGTLGDVVRINNNRTVTIKAEVDATKVPGPVARAQAEEMLKSFPFPSGYRMTFTGEFESQQESQDFLSKAFVVALFLIFLILVSIFNSVTQPLIIMTSVILSLGGVFAGLLFINAPFGIIMTGVGVISLAGVVVNNAIVLIDYTNQLIIRGVSAYDAIILAGATRLRPVLLTAITTILGLVPMVTGISYDFHKMQIAWVSESTEWWRSMASVVIFGLALATFLTLVVVPILYSLNISVRKSSKTAIQKLKYWYWKPIERFL